MPLEFTKSTDSENEIKLDSYLISALFNCTRAVPGAAVPFEVLTSFVGAGAPIKIKGKSERGESLGSVSGVVQSNSFGGELNLPADIEPGDVIYFEVKLSKNSLEGESERIPVVLPVRIFNLQWGATEARRGDVLNLTADVSGLRDGTEVTITIYEHDQDGAHDRIIEIPAQVSDSKVCLCWEYEYHEDTDEILTQEELDKYGSAYNPPEYFFTVKYQSTEFGAEQESQLLTFKDWIEIVGKNRLRHPLRNQKYVLHHADGKELKGTLDDDGQARVENVPPGKYRVEFPDL